MVGLYLDQTIDVSGTNYIGGTGETQSKAAWLVPITIQILPAIILGIGIMFLPQSPRWLMDQGRDDECLAVIANLRRQSPDSQLVQLEYLEIKAQKLFEQRISEHDYPHLQDSSAKSRFLLGVAGYKSLITSRTNLKRTAVAVLIMVFQQWTGVGRMLELQELTIRSTLSSTTLPSSSRVSVFKATRLLSLLRVWSA